MVASKILRPTPTIGRFLNEKNGYINFDILGTHAPLTTGGPEKGLSLCQLVRQNVQRILDWIRMNESHSPPHVATQESCGDLM